MVYPEFEKLYRYSSILRDERNSIVGLWNTQELTHVGLEFSPAGRAVVRSDSEEVVCQEEGVGVHCLALDGRLPFGFNSAWRSPATGLYAMRHRWYSPRLGQFISYDPLGTIDSYNLYAFASFDPINGWDPWGLSNCSLTGNCFFDGVAEAAQSDWDNLSQTAQTASEVVDSAGQIESFGQAAVVAKDTALGSAETIGQIASSAVKCGGDLVVCISDKKAAQDAAIAMVERDTDRLLKIGGKLTWEAAKALIAEGAGRASQLKSIRGADKVPEQLELFPERKRRPTQGELFPDEVPDVPEGTAGGPRAGKDFTPKMKEKIKNENRRKNGGVLVCERCGKGPLVEAEKSKKGVTPPENEVQIDHTARLS